MPPGIEEKQDIRVIKGHPPNIQKIVNVFGDAALSRQVVFTYGRDIYNPDGFVQEDVVAHEIAHVIQQGSNPEAWWDRYLSDTAFRAAQELDAYRAQWKFIKSKLKDRNARARKLHTLASHMSSPLYGKLMDYSDAKKAIEKI